MKEEELTYLVIYIIFKLSHISKFLKTFGAAMQ